MSGTYWQVRTSDGAVVSFPSADVLRAWIGAGRIDGEAEVSADGVSWRRLGSVPELMTTSGDGDGAGFDQIPVEMTDIVEVQEFALDGAYVGSAVLTLDEEVEARDRVQDAHTRVFRPVDADVRALTTWPDAALRGTQTQPAGDARGGRGGSGPWTVLLVGILIGMVFFIYWRETSVIEGQRLSGGSASVSTPATPTAVPEPPSSPTPPPARPDVVEASVASDVMSQPEVQPLAIVDAGPILEADVTESRADPTPAPAKKVVKATPALPHGFDGIMRAGSRALKKGDTEVAMGHFRRAATLRPQNPEVHDRLGRTFLRRGDGQRALDAFNKCLRASARYGPCLFGLGRAQERVGHRAAARQAYQQYLDKHPDGSYSSRVRERMAALGR